MRIIEVPISRVAQGQPDGNGALGRTAQQRLLARLLQFGGNGQAAKRIEHCDRNAGARLDGLMQELEICAAARHINEREPRRRMCREEEIERLGVFSGQQVGATLQHALRFQGHVLRPLTFVVLRILVADAELAHQFLAEELTARG